MPEGQAFPLQSTEHVVDLSPTVGGYGKLDDRNIFPMGVTTFAGCNEDAVLTLPLMVNVYLYGRQNDRSTRGVRSNLSYYVNGG